MRHIDTFFLDGKLADGQTLSDRFTDMQSAINALEAGSANRLAFNSAQAASPLGGLFGASDFTVVGDHARHVYTSAVFGGDIVYPGFDDDTGSDSAPLAGGGSGWICIGHPSQTGAYSGPLARITYSSPIALGPAEPVQAVLVLFNCEVYESSADPDFELVFCLQVKKGTTWRTLAHTERPFRPEDHMIDPTSGTELLLADIPIATLLTADVIAAEAGTGDIRGVRAMMSWTNPVAGTSVKLGRFSLTALPIRCRHS